MLDHSEFAENSFCAGSEDGKFRILDWNQNIISFQAHEKALLSLAYLLEKEWLFTGSADETVKVWKINRTHSKASITLLFELKGHRDYVRSLTLLSDNILARGAEDNTIKLWSLENGNCIDTLQHQNYVKALRTQENGNLLGASYDSTIKNWNSYG